MTNPPKKKGTAAEVDVVQCLRMVGGYAGVERRTLAGIHDRGDIAGIPGLVIEVKNQQAMDLAGWVDEAEQEAANAGKGVLGVVWHKRRGKASATDWYVTMDGWTFLEFLREWTK